MRTALVLLILTAILLMACDNRGSGSENDPSKTAQMQTLIDTTATTNGVPGMVLYVKDGNRAAYTLTTGYRRLDPDSVMTSNCHFRIGSVTKSFTAAAILKLAEARSLDLGDPITAYVDSSFATDYPVLTGVTIRNLLTMRSGIPDYIEDTNTLLAIMLTNPTLDVPPEFLVQIAMTVDPNLYFTPGTQWEYSNTNYILLGMALEKVTGISWADYITQEFISPLGLTQTSYPVNALLPEPYANGYVDDIMGFMELTVMSPTVAWAAGGLVSTATDVARWMEMLVEGQVLSGWAFAQMTDFLPVEYDQGYGCGLLENTTTNLTGHSGSIPGFMAEAWHNTENDITIVLLLNLYEADSDYTLDVVTRVMEILGHPATRGMHWVRTKGF